jgi:L-ascorbate metabolism protein UlaG (beta-lactamase superfamily)
MMKRKLAISIGIIFMALACFERCSAQNESVESAEKFYNSEIYYQTHLSNVWDIAMAYLSADRKAAMPTKDIPLNQLSRLKLENDESDAIFRLGHSSLLIRLNREFILIDPVFSERASPVQWAGPKRFHPAPISIEALPRIKVVIISHDHYDHLDQDTIKALNSKVDHFITPLNVGKYLTKWGVATNKITELNWWESTTVGTLNFVATPAQHFSGRGLFDKDSTLWASWVIQHQQTKLFFSGDSGYFSGFKEIGERYGPFDITMIETGAYNPLWREIHMQPQESLQAHLDLNGKYMLPVHNGTFDLALHDWHEPFEKISDLANAKSVALLTPIFGEKVDIKKPNNKDKWWQPLIEKKSLAITAN